MASERYISDDRYALSTSMCYYFRWEDFSAGLGGKRPGFFSSYPGSTHHANSVRVVSSCAMAVGVEGEKDMIVAK